MAFAGSAVVSLNRDVSQLLPLKMPRNSSEPSAVILSLYEGLLQPVRWQQTLDLVGRYLKASCVTLAIRPTSPDDPGSLQSSHALNARGESEVVSQILRQDIIDRYVSHYFQFDPFHELPTDRVVVADEVLGELPWLSSKFYRELLEPAQVRHIMGVNIVTEAGTIHRLRASRLKNQPAFGEFDKARLAALVPHFKRAIALAHHIDVSTAERELYEGALDRLNIATIVLDEDGNLLKANGAANRLLKAGDALRLVRCRLEGRVGEETKRFQDLVAQAQADGGRRVYAMSLGRRDSPHRLGMVIRGVPLRDGAEDKHRPAVAIFLRDPDASAKATQEMMGRIFGFSPAEARLATELANGSNIDQAASALNIRRNTARAQLRSIFGKAGVTRQSELMRILLNGVLGLSRTD